MRSIPLLCARPALKALTVFILVGAAVGCTSTRRSDFYAMRSVRISSSQGDGTMIVRAEPADLLARERQALALGRGD